MRQGAERARNGVELSGGWQARWRPCGVIRPLGQADRRAGPLVNASVANSLSADDILPLVAALTPEERARLLRLMALPQRADALAYRSPPPSRDEFSSDEDPLAWEAEGWEDLG